MRRAGGRQQSPSVASADPLPQDGTDQTDIGAQRSRELIDVIALAFLAIIVIAVGGRLLLEPELAVKDLPMGAAAVGSLAAVLGLNRAGHYPLAAFLFCSNFVWLNVVEGWQRPEGPIWYALVPLATISGAVFLRFRAALVLAALGVLGVLVVLGRSQLPVDVSTLILMYVALANAAALGLATFRERVERERRARLAELSQQLASVERLESIGRLAGGVAHDFNNLLAVILTSADAARAGDLAALDDVVEAGRRATVLTKQLLAFSRQPGRRTVTVAVDDAINGVRPLLRRLLPENIELELDLRAGGLVRLEEQQLEQVLFNLAANARDAMPTGGRLRIETSIRVVPPGGAPSPDPGEYVAVVVSDSGAGMDQRTRRRAFEPFFTTKDVGKGTGLGLATVHGIVRQTGGFLELDTAPGEGTRFVVAFPRTRAALEGAVAERKASGPLVGRVLLVEDEALLRRATERLLSALGLTVITASRADEVPSALAASPGPLALVVTDVVMPGRSGLELVEELRADQPDLPVLLLSGYAEESLVHVLDGPRTRFLAKPFAKDAFTEALCDLLAPRLAAGSPSGS